MKKLRDYAKEHGVTYRTAYSHFRLGLIQGAYQLPTSTIVVPDNYVASKKEMPYVITYARVSSSENKNNLNAQSQRLYTFCVANGWAVSETILEIGSGINDARPKLLKILQEGKATTIVVEHKDRLSRFGFNYIKELCNKFNCKIIIINDVVTEKEDIIQDFVSIITSFCAKLYGQRRSKRKTEKIIAELEAK